MGRWKDDEARKAYFRARYHAKRQAIIKSLGGKCARCGSVDDLEIDHIDSSKKLMDVSQCWALAPARLAEELKKCQVLCGACHKTKTVECADYPAESARHGTDHMYTKFKCRCDLCKEARSKARKVWRDRRAAQGIRPT